MDPISTKPFRLGCSRDGNKFFNLEHHLHLLHKTWRQQKAWLQHRCYWIKYPQKSCLPYRWEEPRIEYKEDDSQQNVPTEYREVMPIKSLHHFRSFRSMEPEWTPIYAKKNQLVCTVSLIYILNALYFCEPKLWTSILWQINPLRKKLNRSIPSNWLHLTDRQSL